jgi:hypothetical protein
MCARHKRFAIKSGCRSDGALKRGEALVQLYKVVFRQVTRASGGDTLSPRQKRRADVGMLGGICNVIKGTQQSQAHRDIGGPIVPNLLECRVK